MERDDKHTTEFAGIKTPGTRHFFLVSLLFLLSGLASLIYQVIWTRQLTFVFGSTSFATATVLSVFMGGLALGSFLAARRCDRLPTPFLYYGILEAAIGAWALAAPGMFDLSSPLYKSISQHTHLSFMALSLLRFLVAAIILLPPTTCMGATLPLLSRFVADNLENFPRRAGLLYSLNTLGAVIGTILSGFLLIPSFGLSATTCSAASLNFLLAISALWLHRRWRTAFPRVEPCLRPLWRLIFTRTITWLRPRWHHEFFRTTDWFRRRWRLEFHLRDKTPEIPVAQGKDNRQPASAAAQPKAGLHKTRLPRTVIATITAFAISGAIAMVNEVAWTRLLLMVIGSTTYAFSIMLSTFLAGIFLGSLILSYLARQAKHPVLWFAILQMVLGGAELLSLHLFNYLPYCNLLANLHFYNNAAAGMCIRFFLASVVLLPVSLPLGAMFPLVVKICTKDLASAGRSVGSLYSANTLGAIAGAFAAGFLLVPAWGVQNTLIICALANCATGTAVMFACSSTQRASKAVSLLILLALVLWAIRKPELIDCKWLTACQGMRRGLRSGPQKLRSYEECKTTIDKFTEMLYWHEGICSNVAIIREAGCTSLFTNGHVDASTSLDRQTQALLPTIPLLLNPAAVNVGVVGWGSGATAGYSLLFPIHKLVCAEIESAVLDTSSFFHSINLAPERDSRLHVKINDGRNYLMTTDELFDVIASEPSNPWQAGVSNLFTREYFQICHDRLRSGGLFSLWCQYVELSTDDLCRILSALKHVFKHVIIFSTGTDMVIVSSDTPIKIKLPAVAAALQSARMKEALAQTAGISQPEDLPAYIAMAEDGVDRAVEGQPPCTDDRNYIEFDVAKNYEQHNYSQANTNWLTQNAGSLWKTIDWGSLPDKDKAETMNMIAESALAHNIPNAELWAYQSAKLFSTSHAWQIIAMIEAEKNGNFTRALQAARQAVEQFPQDKQAHCMKGLIELMGGAPMSARRDFQTALRLSPNEKIYKYRLAQTYLPQYRPWYQLSKTPFKDSATAGSDPQKALELLSPLVEDKNFLSEHPAIMPLLAAARLQLGDTTSGIVLMQVYLQTQPDDKLARQLLEAALSARASAKETEHRSIKRQAQISK